MPRQSVINEMKCKARGAPKNSQAKIDTLLDLYQTGQLNNKDSLENAIIALTCPVLFGKKKAEVLYHKATSEFVKQKTLIRKIKMNFTLKVRLFTDVDRGDPDKDLQGKNELDEDNRKKYRKYLSKKYPNHRRFWAGALNVR